MAEGFAGPVVLDATVLSNFASSNAVGWLVEPLERPTTVPAVQDGLERGRDYGHEFLDTAIESLDDGIPVLETPSGESIHMGEVRGRLDPGKRNRSSELSNMRVL